MFHAILLRCLKQLQGERSLSSVYHLLTGKKSTQTIQDAKLFQVEVYFGVYPTLNRLHYDKTIKKFQKQQLLDMDENQGIQLTSDGEKYLHSINDIEGLDWFQGYTYHKMAPLFLNRLLLFIQTASNMLNQQKEFVPIVDDETAKRWVRQYFHHNKRNLEGLFNNLYKDLMLLFESIPSPYRDIIIARMSGYKLIGLSKDQIATQVKITVDDVELYLQATIHYILNKVSENNHGLKVLPSFVPNISDALPLTTSAQKTLMFYRQGISLSEIAAKRKLKRSTIQDHIIEIAVVEPSFSIHSFVSKDKERIILAKVQELQTKRLKVIKESLPNDIDYFDIRLVFAKHFSS